MRRVSKKRTLKISKEIFLAFSCFIINWIVGLFLAISGKVYFILIITALISLIPIILVIIYKIRKGSIKIREERNQIIEAEFQEQLIQSKYNGKQKNVEELSKNFSEVNLEKINAMNIDVVKKKKYIYTVSRIPISPGHDILQCPQCKSYFEKINLMIWFEKKKNCPVCKAKLLL